MIEYHSYLSINEQEKKQNSDHGLQHVDLTFLRGFSHIFHNTKIPTVQNEMEIDNTQNTFQTWTCNRRQHLFNYRSFAKNFSNESINVVKKLIKKGISPKALTFASVDNMYLMLPF
jgi:predicted transcriptional regulator YheO